MLCRSIADVEAAADAESADPPLSQETADRVAAIRLAAGSRERAA